MNKTDYQLIKKIVQGDSRYQERIDFLKQLDVFTLQGILDDVIEQEKQIYINKSVITL